MNTSVLSEFSKRHLVTREVDNNKLSLEAQAYIFKLSFGHVDR